MNAGCTREALGRLLARQPAAAVGVPVKVEKRVGASAAIGAEEVARSRPAMLSYGYP